MPVVSIIVPVYKVEKYIGECIESLQKQTLKDIEILLIDDGSPDNSGAICDEYGKKDARITVIHQNNAGVSAARNAGLSKAKGDWIVFVDGDDYAAEKMCEDAVNAAIQHSADIVMFSYYTLNNDTAVLSKLIKEDEGDISDKKEYIQKKTITQYYDREIASVKGVSAGTCWGKIIRSSVLRDSHVLFVPGLIRAQDTVFWLNAFEYASSIYYLDKPLYYYRVTDTNITSGSRFIPDSVERFGKLIEEYISFITTHHKDDSFLRAFHIRTLQILYWHLVHNIFHTDNSDSLREKLELLRKICEYEPYKSALLSGEEKTLPKSTRLLLAMCKRRKYLLCFYSFKLLEIRKELIKESGKKP